MNSLIMEFYKMLRVEKKALLEEIKAAYRVLAFNHHPDEERERLTANFQSMVRAKNILSDNILRRIYDP